MFFAKKLNVLGHTVTEEGMIPNDKELEAILHMPTPSNAAAVKRFLGLCGYFRDYIRNMSSRAQAFRKLLMKGTKFVWSEEHQINGI